MRSHCLLIENRKIISKTENQTFILSGTFYICHVREQVLKWRQVVQWLKPWPTGLAVPSSSPA